jgi:hypothetical protein
MGEFARLGDVVGTAQLFVKTWEVPKRDPGVNVMGKVKANVVRNKKKSGECTLMHAVRGAASVSIGGHPSMFSNRAQPVDNTPYREIRKQPHERVQQWNT